MSGRIIFATGNADKMREIHEILCDIPMEIFSMKELQIETNIEENGNTYEENALIKARAIVPYVHNDDIIMADDSGLEIDYLNKEPGIFSARYMGEDTSYRIKNQNLIDRLNGVPDDQRTARFVCAIAAVFPNGKELTVRGIIEGRIAYKEYGLGGFGYDPIFFLPAVGKTTAQLSEDEKNQISHRGNALRKMKEKLKELM